MNGPDIVVCNATDVIEKNYFKDYADAFLNRLPPGIISKNEKLKSRINSISPALVGLTVENLFEFQLSPNHTLNALDTCIERYRKKYNSVFEKGYEWLELGWIVYDELDYDLCVDIIVQNFFYMCTIGVDGPRTSFVKKDFIFKETNVHEERGWKWVKNADYYGDVIDRLESLKDKCSLFLADQDLGKLLCYDFTNDFIMFSNISNPMFGANGPSKFRLHKYEKNDVLYMLDLLRQMPKLSYVDKFAIKPRLHFRKGGSNGKEDIELSFKGTPDFILDNYIVDIKATNSINRSSYYQMLFYYILAKYGLGQRYDKIDGCSLLFVKHNKAINLEFSKLISDDEGEKFFTHILENMFSYYFNNKNKYVGSGVMTEK